MYIKIVKTLNSFPKCQFKTENVYINKQKIHKHQWNPKKTRINQLTLSRLEKSFYVKFLSTFFLNTLQANFILDISRRFLLKPNPHSSFIEQNIAVNQNVNGSVNKCKHRDISNLGLCQGCRYYLWFGDPLRMRVNNSFLI